MITCPHRCPPRCCTTGVAGEGVRSLRLRVPAPWRLAYTALISSASGSSTSLGGIWGSYYIYDGEMGHIYIGRGGGRQGGRGGGSAFPSSLRHHLALLGPPYDPPPELGILGGCGGLTTLAAASPSGSSRWGFFSLGTVLL